MKSNPIKTICILFCISSVFSQDVSDSSFWGGPTRDGLYPASDLLDAWPEGGPELLWSADSIGSGYSAAAAAGDRVYVSGMLENQGYLFAFDLDGAEVWRTAYGAEWTRGFPGTRSTAVVHLGLIYLESAMGVVFSISAVDGSIVWTRELLNLYGGDNIQYGLSESVLVHKDKVICTPGGPEKNIVALDRLTGETIWTSKGKGEPQAYCSPTIISRNGMEFIVTITGGSILALDFKTGEVLWDHIFISRNGYFPNTPIYRDGFIYCVSGYRSGGIMLQLSPDNRQVAEIWRNASLDNQMGGVVVVDGYIYGSGHQNEDTWQCLNWQTGEQIYSIDKIRQGGIIHSDGKFYCYSEDGTVSLVKADERDFQVISSFSVNLGSGEHFAHHIIHRGRLFVRHGSSLAVYNISK